MTIEQPRRGVATQELMVMLALVEVEFGIVIGEGEEVYTRGLEPAETYHMMTHNEQRHTLDAVPKGMDRKWLSVFTFQGVTTRESRAIGLGAVRCVDCCAWPRVHVDDTEQTQTRIRAAVMPTSAGDANGNSEETR